MRINPGGLAISLLGGCLWAQYIPSAVGPICGNPNCTVNGILTVDSATPIVMQNGATSVSNTTTNTLETITPAATSPSFLTQIAPFTQTGCTPNVVLRSGWNISTGGGLADNSYAAVADEWESHYCPSAADPHVERHIAFVGTDSSVTRIFSASHDEATKVASLSSTHDQFTFIDRASSTPYATFRLAAIDILGGSILRLNTNNSTKLQQLNAAGNAYVGLISLNSSNKVVLDPDGAGAVMGGLLTLGSVAFSALSSSTNGTAVYCSDCTVTSAIDNTCAASGSGAFAQRVNGAWKCAF